MFRVGYVCLLFVAVSCASKASLAQQPNPCALSHKPVFYANDFSYLNDPAFDGSLGDIMKQIPVDGGDWGTLDIGGQVRERYHHEQGMGRVGGATCQDSRTRTPTLC